MSNSGVATGGDSKLLTSTSAPRVEGGAPSGAGTTTKYVKKGQTQAAPNLDASRLNPMHNGKSTFGLGGV